MFKRITADVWSWASAAGTPYEDGSAAGAPQGGDIPQGDDVTVR
jgi:hypothetical protein